MSDENKKTTTTVVKDVEEKETKKFPWARLIGALLVLIALIGFFFIARNWLDTRVQRNTKAAVAEALAEAEGRWQTNVVTDDRDNKDEVTTSGTIGSDADGSYFPELSCSHLPSCQITEVPEGYFTIGYTDNGNGCDWIMFDEGESIDYAVLDEFHTYNNLLPLTRLEGFVASQFMYVLACTNN